MKPTATLEDAWHYYLRRIQYHAKSDMGVLEIVDSLSIFIPESIGGVAGKKIPQRRKCMYQCVKYAFSFMMSKSTLGNNFKYIYDVNTDPIHMMLIHMRC